MLQKTSTFKHAHEYCPRCKTTRHTLIDDHHAEVYCNKCGLVIRDTSINSIYNQIKLAKYNEKRLYNLYKKRRII